MTMGILEPLMTSARTGLPDKDEWRTPQWLYDKLDEEFHFDLDPAATDDNAIAPYYFTKEDNGLTTPWYGSVYVNCPYSQMKAWVQKGYTEVVNGNCSVVVMLLAARTDTKAWWDYVRHAEVRFLKGRLKFGLPLEYIEAQKIEAAERAAQGKVSKVFTENSAPFPSALAIFRPELNAKTVYWEVSEKRNRRRK